MNFNCPGQTVVSGKEEQLALLEQEVAAAGGRAMRLKVSGSFHSPYMEEASAGLAEYMAALSFCSPAFPSMPTPRPSPIRRQPPRHCWRSRSKSPVLWQKSIEALKAQGCTAFVEVGAGKTLTGLMRKIAAEAVACNVENPETLQSAAALLKGAFYGK